MLVEVTSSVCVFQVFEALFKKKMFYKLHVALILDQVPTIHCWAVCFSWVLFYTHLGSLSIFGRTSTLVACTTDSGALVSPEVCRFLRLELCVGYSPELFHAFCSSPSELFMYMV